MLVRLIGGDERACGSSRGGKVRSLASPTLNAEEMKDGKTERRTGPGWVGEPDTFEAYQARQCAGGGRREEGLDLR